MKKSKLIKAILAGFLAFVLVGCGNSSSKDQGSSEDAGTPAAGGADVSDGINIVATTTQMADLIRVIGGDHVNVTQLMGPGVDPHGYEPTPSDVDAFNEAEVVAYNGLHLEAMFTDIFHSMESSGKEVISAEDALEGEELLDSEDESLEKDPHIWFSVSLWKIVAQHTADRLAEIDPDNKADYQANAEAYLAELDELDTYIRDRVAEIPEGQRYLVTAHDAFNYLGNEYGITVMGIQGLSTQTEAGTGDISEIAQFIVDNEIKAVFIESSVSDRNVEALIEAVEAEGGTLEIGGELYSDSLGDEASGADSYLTMYKTNIDTIVDALK